MLNLHYLLLSGVTHVKRRFLIDHIEDEFSSFFGLAHRGNIREGLSSTETSDEDDVDG